MSACQMCAVVSPLAVSTMSRVGWNRMELTEPLCPVYLRMQLPLVVLHTPAVWSAEAVPE